MPQLLELQASPSLCCSNPQAYQIKIIFQIGKLRLSLSYTITVRIPLIILYVLFLEQAFI